MPVAVCRDYLLRAFYQINQIKAYCFCQLCIFICCIKALNIAHCHSFQLWEYVGVYDVPEHRDFIKDRWIETAVHRDTLLLCYSSHGKSLCFSQDSHKMLPKQVWVHTIELGSISFCFFLPTSNISGFTASIRHPLSVMHIHGHTLTGPHKIIKGDNDSTGLNAQWLH